MLRAKRRSAELAEHAGHHMAGIFAQVRIAEIDPYSEEIALSIVDDLLVMHGMDPIYDLADDDETA